MKFKVTKVVASLGILAVLSAALCVMVPASQTVEAEELAQETKQQTIPAKTEDRNSGENNSRGTPPSGIEEIKERGVLVAGIPRDDLLAFYEDD